VVWAIFVGEQKERVGVLGHFDLPVEESVSLLGVK